MGADDLGLPSFEQRYEHAACGLLLTSVDGLLLAANQTFCTWVGRSRSELLGKVKFQNLLTMGGRIFHQTHWQPLLQIQGSVAEVKMELLHGDGRRIPIVLNAVRREHAGTIYHELAAFLADDRDRYERELLLARERSEEIAQREQVAQAELKVAQERLRLALHSANLYVWEVSPANGARMYEQDVALLLGEPAARAVSGDEFRLAIHPDDQAREAELLRKVLNEGSGDYFCTFRLVLPDESLRTVRATGQAVSDGAGRLLRFVGVIQDLTELTAQRAAAEDRAVFAEEMMGIASHDLRNPLAAIAMNAQVLARTGASPAQLSVLGRIANSNSRAQRLISDLLDFTEARIGRGLSVSLRAVNPHEVVAQSLVELRALYPDRTIEHSLAGAGECRGDPDRLAQMLGNLVSNAVSYGAPTSAIRVSSEIGQKNYCISVHNAGPPIPAEEMEGLFRPMQRGSGARRGNKNVGLGLYIVQQIAMANKGVVEVASTADEGTRFTIRIPRD